MSEQAPTHAQLSEQLTIEQQELEALCARMSDEQWTNTVREDGWTVHDIVGHIAGSAYGMSQVVIHGPPESFDMDTFNEQRRQEARGKSRAELTEFIKVGFDTARSTVAQVPDLSAPSPFNSTLGQWFQMIALHSAGHRHEIEQAIG